MESLISHPFLEIYKSLSEGNQIKESQQIVNSEKKEDVNVSLLSGLIKNPESHKIEQEKYQSALFGVQLPTKRQSVPINVVQKLHEPQQIESPSINSNIINNYQKKESSNQINSQLGFVNISQIEQPKDQLLIENLNEKNAYQIVSDSKKQYDSGSSMSRQLQFPENNKMLNLNSDLSDSKISKQFFPINRTNGIQEANIHFFPIQGQSLSSSKTGGRNSIISRSLNNQTPINGDDRASLESIFQQAQLLIQLNSNSKAESIVALKELSQIQITLQSNLISNDKIITIQKLSQGMGYQAKMLLNLINDLLDYAKFENGKFIFYNEIFDLANLIKDNAFQTMNYAALEKTIELVFTAQLELADGSIVDEYDFSNIENSKKDDEDQIQESFDKQIQKQQSQEIIEKLFLQKVFGDEKRYLQVLLNFLSNAIKFTQSKGQVKVNVKITKIEFQSKQQKHSSKEDKVQQKFRDSNQSEKKISDSSFQYKLPNILSLIAYPKIEENKNDNFQFKKTPSSYNSGLKTAKLSSINNKSLRKNSSNDCRLSKEFLQDDFYGERSRSKSRSSHFQNMISEDMLNQDENKINQQINKINDKVKGQNFSQEEDENNYKIAHVIFIIEIIDSGIGIRQENINQLFMEFSKLEESSQMNRQGTGLGLTISKKIIKQMGGDITVKSIFGKGTTFTIELKTKVKILKQDLLIFEEKEVIKRSRVIKSAVLSSFDYKFSGTSNSKNEQQSSKNKNLFKNFKDCEVNQTFFQQQQPNNEENPNNQSSNLEIINALSVSSYSEKFVKKEEIAKPVQSIYKEENRRIREQSQLLEELLKESLKKNLNNLNLKNQSDQFNLFGGQQVIQRQDNRPEFLQASFPLNNPQNSYQNNQLGLDGQTSQISEQYQLQEINKNLQNMQNNRRFSQILKSPQNFIPKQSTNQSPIQELSEFEPQVNKVHVSFGLESASNVNNKVPNSFYNFEHISYPPNFGILGEMNSQNYSEKTVKKSLVSQKITLMNQAEINSQKQILQSLSLENNFSISQQEKTPKFQQEQIHSPRIKKRSSLSPSFFFSPNEAQKDKPSELKIELKCLVANDEPYQLKMMTIPLTKMNFKCQKAENGFVAFLKVRKFVEDYNKVRQVLQKPGSSTKHLNKEQLEIIQSSLKNFDVIILDLNMPIMNGYEACERILEVYKSFNSLPDYDDLMGNNLEEEKKITKLQKLFEDIELNKDVRIDEDSEELFSLKIDSVKSKEDSLKSLQDMIQDLKTFYEFKRHFNGMLRVKPLIVACSADINERIIRQASEIGFDKVIQAPLTEHKIRDSILPELERRFKMGKNVRMYSQKQKQQKNVKSQGLRLTKKFSQVQLNLFKSSANIQQLDEVEIDKYSV